MTSKKKRYGWQLKVYVPEDKQRLIEVARQIFKREGESLSRWFLEQLETYVRLHEPGNPQQTITQYADEGKPYVAPKKCQFHYCNRPAVTVVVNKKSGREYAVCSFHRDACLESGKWREKDPVTEC